MPAHVQAHYNPAYYTLPAPHATLSLGYWRMLRARNEQHLFNGELFRLENFEATPECLHLKLTRTCYRDQIYCKAHTAALTQAHGVEVLARGLGVSAMVSTSDGFLPLMRRGLHVGEEPGKLDVFGGHAHPDQHLRAGAPDLFCAIAEEIVAELNVAANDILESTCRGLVENLHTHKPDLVFEISLRNTRDEIARMAVNAPEAEEMAELFFIAATSEALQDFLAAQASALTPSAHATLSLFAALRARSTLSH